MMLNICWTSMRKAGGFSLAPDQWNSFYLTDHFSVRLFIKELPSATCNISGQLCHSLLSRTIGSFDSNPRKKGFFVYVFIFNVLKKKKKKGLHLERDFLQLTLIRDKICCTFPPFVWHLIWYFIYFLVLLSSVCFTTQHSSVLTIKSWPSNFHYS